MKLEIKNITKEFKDKKAVNNFNVTLTPGVYGLLGPNGAGKTTLMRIIADVSQPSQGNIYVDGESKDKMKSRYTELLGYLPQHIGFYKNFKAIDFLYYVCSLKGLPKKIWSDKCESLLKFVNLYDDRKRKIGGFSGGMKQRLGIAQALLNDPKILILDEPTAGLDPNERIRFKNLISDISKDKIVILSTHITSDIEFIANEVIIMKNGVLVDKLSTADILNKLNGKVYSVNVNQSEMEKIKMKYRVSNTIRDNNGINVRFISEVKPDLLSSTLKLEEPNLEDAFLFYFNEKEMA
ncbi:ABC transporter ATP-binding protein [Clostridium sp. CCUG 7971]|uniref:ABC transporter ATP-binding protein n=1 Tax=Clostridium sp. CCUG 7971 TaxID=2811414 RepID=UPI001ABBCF75|nr:ABC transporter ATP-binding protein [Clostridium sp. CCUG 7971]MBO3445277.1 ABC transporter ATP-binding protein [Clostridium sp. CCUG 7971]